jgi:Tfp pilus assembly protein PilV
MRSESASDCDTGSSLVETVVGISLLGLILVGVVDASWTSTRVAADIRQRSVAQSRLAESGDVLRASDYSPCPHIDLTYALNIDEAQTSDTWPDDRVTPDVTITSHEYWNRSSSQWLSMASLSSNECSSIADLNDRFAVQRITVSVSDPDGSSVSAMFVKTYAPQA